MKVVALILSLATLFTIKSFGRARLLQSRSDYNTLTFDHDNIHFVHSKGEAHVNWGMTIPEGTESTPCGEGDSCLDFGVAKVVVTTDGHCQRVSWTTTELSELRDCVAIEGHWYGGGEQIYQPWPIENRPRPETAFVTADMLQKRFQWYGGVSEAYWISSQGVALRVEESTPLFLSVPDHNNDTIADDLCLGARHEAPFAAAPSAPLVLDYFLCSGEDVRQVHELTFPKFFSLPEGIPDERMIRDPIWSTWAKFHTQVNDSKVFDFAMEVKNQGFNNSQVEIDDNWETCYGDAVFNPDRFPDPKKLFDDLKSEGYRVTLWIHPFINNDCASFAYADERGYFVKDAEGTTQLTSWWQGRHSGIIDFTNPQAATWWANRLIKLREDTGLDSYKFDAGEASWLPEIFTLGVDERFWPNAYTLKYVETVAQFGGMIETRVGRGTQKYPIFVRMLDKDSIWEDFNGLRTMVPSLLHFGILGYPYVLPDMIGGNAYVIKPGSELYIRWAQSNTFMPSLQFSLLPWDFEDQQVTELTRVVTSLHVEYTPLLLDLAAQATVTPAPILRPTWWLCPTTEECLMANQQFLVGDDILVTPVVHKGATELQVVIPPGEWRQDGTGTVYSGPATVTIADITLESNVFFTRVSST